MNPLDIIEAKRALAGIAELLAAYRADLIEQGFSPAEALAIVVSYQAAILAVPPRRDD